MPIVRARAPLHLTLIICLLVALISPALPASRTAQAAGPPDISYIYDESGRMSGVVDGTAAAAAYRYDAVGNLTSIARTTAAQVSIIEFSPNSGPVGTALTIFGTGFSATASQNTVTVNGTAASVTSASTIRLVVNVPAGATTGPIAITTPSGSATSNTPFTVTAATGAPTISGVSPGMGVAGTSVTISGTHFQTTPANDRVTYNGMLALVNTATATSLTTSVPSGATSGRIAVATPDGRVVGGSDFFVPPAPYTTSDIEFTGRMVLGEIRPVAITTANKIGLMLFDGIAGQRASLKLTAVTTASSKVTIYDPTGAVLTSLAGIGTSGGFVDAQTLPVDGTYTILVDPDTTNTGSMTLNLYNATDTTTTITPGGAATTVTTTVAGQNARATFTGSAGQRVSLKLTAVTIGTSSCCSAKVSLLKPDGSTLLNPTYFGTIDSFVDVQTLSVAGTYTILIDPQDTSTGSATLTLYNVPADPTSSITPGGAAVTVTSGTPGQNARATFSGSAGQRVSLKLTAVTIGTSTCCSAKVSLLKPDGSALLSPAYFGTTGSFVDVQTLPAAGTYTILIDPQDASIGSVTLTLYNVPADPTSSITPGGAALTVTSGTPGQNAKATFSGSAGQRVSLKLTSVTIGTSTCCSAKVSLLKPDGSTLLNPTYFGTVDSFVDVQALPVAGTYTILIDPQDASTGSATLTLYNVPADPTSSITPGGAALTVTSGTPGQNARATFTGSAGQRISLKLTAVTIGSSTCCSAKVSLLKPDGSALVSPTYFGTIDSFVDVQTLPVAGTYTILIDPQDASTGSATLTLYNVPADPTTSMTIGGAAVTVTSGTPGQNARATFAGSSGQQIRLQLSSVTIGTSTCCSAKVSLLKPDGSTLVSPTYFGTTGQTVNTQLTVNGTYTILIDPQDASTGSATLALTQTGMAAVAAGSAANAPEQAARTAPPANAPPANTTHAAAPPVASSTVVPDQAPTVDELSDDESWTPDLDNPGAWGTGRAPSSWQSLPPLQAAPSVTALAGQVLTLNGKPLAKVTIEIDGIETQTDATGRFLLQPLKPGHHELEIKGASANRSGRHYGFFEAGVEVIDGQTTALSYTIWMPKLDTAHTVKISSPTTRHIVITTPNIPGLELHIPAGTVIIGEDGKPVTEIGITAIPTDRPPFPLPRNVDVPIYFTIQPGGAYLKPKAWLVYPNYQHDPPGALVNFWNYDPGVKNWYVYGIGTVTPNGKQVVPNPGVGIYSFTGAMINGGGSPPGTGPNPDGNGDGDPVDLSTGLFVLDKTDLALPGTLPLVLQRTYRPNDTATRPFGKGANHPFSIFLWSAQQYQEADLILPDGGRIHYVRTSAGTGFTDAVFEHTSSGTPFYKSVIVWNGNGWNLRLKDGTVYVFGENAPLQAIRDRYGNQITLIRTNGQSGNITRLRSTNGRWIEFTYDAGNRITQAKDNIGRVVGYTYDAGGRLWKVTDPNGGVTEYTYDASDRMLTVKDARGIVFLTNQYDANGRVSRQTQADGTTYQFAYTLDANGKVTQTDVTDPRGNVRRVTFNSSGATLTDTYALGKPEQQTFTYNRQAGTNLLLSLTDPLNRRIDYTYDAMGNVTAMTSLAGTPQAATISYTYEPTFNQLASRTDPLGHTTNYTYDSRGNLISVTDPLGHQTSMTYNVAGQPLSIIDPLSNTSQFQYDLGDLIGVTDALGHTTTQFSDSAGRLISVRSANGDGQTARYEYDSLNRLTKMTDALGNATSLAYDANSNLVSLTDARGNATTMIYDNMDRLTSRTDPLLRAEQYQYDAIGNTTKLTDRKGQVTTFAYDNLNRGTFVGFGTTVSGGVPSYNSTITQSYDAGSRITQIVDSGAGTANLAYNGLDRLTSEQTPQGSVGYTYDAAGRRTAMTVGGQPTVAYTYDNADRLTQITQGTANATFNYDAADRRTTLTLPNGISLTYGYDAASHTTGITYKQGATTLGNLSYAYDATGKVTSLGGSFARTGLPTALASATYDAANEMTQRAGVTLTYDANGNLTNDGTKSYTWDARNQLASISGAGLTASFAYDARGRRTSKTVNGTSTAFLYDGMTAIQELSGTTPTANMLTGVGVDEIFTRTDAAGTRALLPDALGSTIALADAAGTLQTQYTYDPFGNTSVSGAASANTNQYTGRENDGTGLYYYRGRYYSPTMQRFISEDPIGQAGGANLYGYIANSPINWVDPTGLSFGDWITNVVGGGLSGFGGGLIYAVNNQNRPTSGGQARLGGPNPSSRYGWDRSFHLDAPHGPVSNYHFNAEIGPLSGLNHAPVPSWAYRLGSSSALKWIGRGTLGLGLALDAYNIATAAPGERGGAIGGAIGGWVGGAIGGMLGGMLLPGIGAPIGGFLGGMLGSMLGQWLGGRKW